MINVSLAKHTVVAHRGAVGLARENTIAAFLKAYNLGYKAIECDLRSCASGELVLFHNDSLSGEFWTGDQISNLSLQRLQQEQALQIATVEELFRQMPPDTMFVLDLKSSGIAQRLAALIIAAEQTGKYQRYQFMATGFHHQEQMYLKELLPGIKIIPAVPIVPYDGVQSLLNMKADGVCLYLGMSGGLLHTDFTQACRDAGLAMWAFVKQDIPEAWPSLRSMGIETLIVNVAVDTKQN
jgi:glycerophosphoryl diester phosphodiesterase